jgi:hypothetical protein
LYNNRPYCWYHSHCFWKAYCKVRAVELAGYALAAFRKGVEQLVIFEDDITSVIAQAAELALTYSTR